LLSVRLANHQLTNERKKKGHKHHVKSRQSENHRLQQVNFQEKSLQRDPIQIRSRFGDDKLHIESEIAPPRVFDRRLLAGSRGGETMRAIIQLWAVIAISGVIGLIAINWNGSYEKGSAIDILKTQVQRAKQ